MLRAVCSTFSKSDRTTLRSRCRCRCCRCHRCCCCYHVRRLLRLLTCRRFALCSLFDGAAACALTLSIAQSCRVVPPLILRLLFLSLHLLRSKRKRKRKKETSRCIRKRDDHRCFSRTHATNTHTHIHNTHLQRHGQAIVIVFEIFVDHEQRAG